MSSSSSAPAAPAVLFLAPPSAPTDDAYADAPPVQRRRSPAPAPSGNVRMTRGARRSATDFGISDSEVAGVLASPARVTPEEDNPDRTRFSGGGLTVVTGADGTVLHVSRRRRS